jgi:hypothetical protein
MRGTSINKLGLKIAAASAAALAGAALIAPAAAQEQPEAPAGATAPTGATGATAQAGAQGETKARPDPVEAYLAAKAREFEGSERAASARNSGGNVTALYNLLREKRAFSGRQVQGRDAAQRGLVEDALARSAAFFLASIGMTPDRVRALQGSGLDPLASASRMIGGGATVEDALALSELAGRARVVSNEAAGGNAVERRVVLELTEVLADSRRGNAAGATRVEIVAPLPQPTASAKVGEELVVFLSSELSAFRKAAGRRNGDGAFAEIASPVAIEGDRLVATVPGQELGRTATYADLKRFAASNKALAQ